MEEEIEKQDEAKPQEDDEKKEEKKEETKDAGEETKEEEKKTESIDSAKISALNKMLDDFENILSKNFCQFANYEDFSFAKSRTTE